MSVTEGINDLINPAWMSDEVDAKDGLPDEVMAKWKEKLGALSKATGFEVICPAWQSLWVSSLDPSLTDNDCDSHFLGKHDLPLAQLC